MTPLLFVLDLAAALYMTGVIWTVQVVHYALFADVGEPAWAAYHAAHTHRMTAVVLPAMVAELISSGLLAFLSPRLFSPLLLWLGFALAVLTWAVTFFVSVPLHAILSRDFDHDAMTRLVRTNWIRTALWTAHALLLLALLWPLLTQAH